MSKSYFKQGNQLLRNRKLKEAVVAYKNAIHNNPNFYLAYHNLGEALEKLGNWEGAIHAYQQSLSLNPNATWSIRYLIRVLRDIGRIEEANRLEESVNFNNERRMVDQAASEFDPLTKSVYLITSIPPSKMKESKRILDCWQELGVSVLTINNKYEAEKLRLTFKEEEIIVADEDLEREYGRPLIKISEAIKKITQFAPENSVCGIVNADVFPNKYFQWFHLFETMSEDELHLFKRTNYSTYNLSSEVDLEPNVYKYGFDLYLFKNQYSITQIMDEVSASDWAFGIPWWDYWFPIHCFAKGYQIKTHETCTIFHRTHPDNFDQQTWHKKGSELINYADSIPTLSNFLGENKANLNLIDACDLVVDFLDARKYVDLELTRQFEPGVTVVTACMNRNDNLTKAVETWIQCQEINQIIIVDWASRTPVIDSLKHINDSRIRVLRTDEPKRWILCPAFNMGLEQVEFDKILKLDADVCLTTDFFQKHDLNKNSFFSGSWKYAKNDNEKRLNGSFFAWSEDIFRVGGYNEVIDTYGFDDSDLYNRLSKFRKQKYFETTSIYHLKQKSSSRIENTNLNDNLKKIDASIYTELEIKKNKYKASLVKPRYGLRNNSNSSHEKDKAIPDHVLYRQVLMNELQKPYSELGLGLEPSFLAELSLDALYVLFKFRHAKCSWRQHYPETINFLSTLPFQTNDLVQFISHPHSPFMSSDIKYDKYPGIVANQ
ncbi:MAG: tetratricopeptide repeat protein, partial [Halothece sp. Uz-M2-17]|nr:tetratricopeptide repeat protein [Halothece sp. Uz-M2-17]